MEASENDVEWTEERQKRYEDDPFDMNASEVFWLAHQPFLESRGYQLRPRYRPGWVKPWTKTPGFFVEEAICAQPWKIIFL